MTQTLGFLVFLYALTLIGAPIAARVLGRLPGAGLAFARILAWVLLAWLVWILGSLGIPNSLALVLVCVLVLAGAGVLLHRRRDREVEPDPFRKRLFVASEALFGISFVIAVIVGLHSPDVWGTEKPMDMMLMNATLADGDFPPRDPWLSGESVNYYYLGQHMFAMAIRVTGIEPSAGYNLSLAALMALVLTTAFALSATLAEAARRQGMRIRRPLLAGALGAILLGLASNFAGGRLVRQSEDLLTYDWFGPSRVIPNTINEFPFFSFVVGDIHAHFIAIPLTLLALAFIVQAGYKGPPRLLSAETFCAALAIGWLYAVNSWSWPVLVGILVLTVLVWISGPHAAGTRRRAVAWVPVVVAAGGVMVLPFVISFEPNVNDTGAIALTREATREPVWTFAKHHLEIYGPLLWLVVAPLLARLVAARHRLRILVWSLSVVALALALLATVNLGGAVLVAALLAGTLAAATARRRPTAERMLWVLAASAFACILGAELGIVRDAFYGGQYERMNTVFKMGYQAWILLAIFGAVALAAAAEWAPRRLPRAAWLIVAVGLVGSTFWFTYGGTYSRKQGFKQDARLDGREWLDATAPGEIAAIDFIRDEVPGDAVVLEAFGGDYAEIGNGRISTYTGRATVIGWQGHELQWSHDVGRPGGGPLRADDVSVMYSATDEAQVRELLDIYGVDYAVIGPIEQTTYGQGGVIASMGETVFEREGTRVIEL